MRPSKAPLPHQRSHLAAVRGTLVLATAPAPLSATLTWLLLLQEPDHCPPPLYHLQLPTPRLRPNPTPPPSHFPLHRPDRSCPNVKRDASRPQTSDATIAPKPRTDRRRPRNADATKRDTARPRAHVHARSSHTQPQNTHARAHDAIGSPQRSTRLGSSPPHRRDGDRRTASPARLLSLRFALRPPLGPLGRAKAPSLPRPPTPVPSSPTPAAHLLPCSPLGPTPLGIYLRIPGD